MARESAFQAKLISRLQQTFPGCMVLKNDPNYIQGVPDLLVLFRNRWAALEVKRAGSSDVQPNQQWYVDQMDAMSFAAFVHPGNVEEVLSALQQAFRSRRNARAS